MFAMENNIFFPLSQDNIQIIVIIKEICQKKRIPQGLTAVLDKGRNHALMSAAGKNLQSLFFLNVFIYLFLFICEDIKNFAQQHNKVAKTRKNLNLKSN